MGRRPPLVREIDAVNPAWAIVSFGTNDLNLGLSPLRASDPYFENLVAVVDRLIDEGVVPILFGPGMRLDTAEAARWTHIYNAITRGIAEARQIPFVDLILATAKLPGYGLARDGIHGNSWVDAAGLAQPCVFTDEALQYYYNVRNLLTIEVLDVLRRSLDGEGTDRERTEMVAPRAAPPLEGEGTVANPFVIDRLPFVHMAHSEHTDARRWATYSPCGPGHDLSGPEVVYRLDLEDPQALRVMVLDRPGVDVDVHLLGPDPTPADCWARDNRVLSGQLGEGTFHLAVDTYFHHEEGVRSGEYLFVVVPCDDEDEDCASSFEPPNDVSSPSK